jgi:hypothetical protein
MTEQKHDTDGLFVIKTLRALAHPPGLGDLKGVEG